jgi:membrane protein YqaA with SNARE-associated domain
MTLSPPMAFILFLLLGCTVTAVIGFFLGYFLGRRSAERERQAGFPVLPAGSQESEVRRQERREG